MLKNKIIIISGGAGLIGTEFTKAVIGQGGIAIIADIDEIAAMQTQKRLSEDLNSLNIGNIGVDITSRDSILAMINTLHARYGKIDALVNNAYPRNHNYGKTFFEVDYESFCQNVSLNLGGNFLMSQQLAYYFRGQGYGNIVNVASIYGGIAPKFEIYERTSMTMPVEYAAIKAAMIHLTKYMAKYFKGMNIRVNALSPGGVTNDQPIEFLEAYRKQCLNKGMLDKSDICGTLIYLLSDMSLYVNGQNIVIDDGFSI